MSFKLASPIAAYFTADKLGTDAVVRCFTPDAVVTDEGRAHSGHAAIREWKDGTSTCYTYTTEPFSSEHVDGQTVISSHLVGDFPGSPLDLRYFFRVAGDKITALTIGG